MSPDTLKQLMEEAIPFNRLLGIRLVEARRNFCRLVVPFRAELVGDFLRPALHGGVISALADAAGGGAVWVTTDDEVRVSTIDLRIDYLRPARLELLAAEATVVRVGNRVGVVDVRLFHPSNESETIATGKGVYNMSKVKP